MRGLPRWLSQRAHAQSKEKESERIMSWSRSDKDWKCETHLTLPPFLLPHGSIPLLDALLRRLFVCTREIRFKDILLLYPAARRQSNFNQKDVI